MAFEDIDFQVVDVDVEAAYEDAKGLAETYPQRGPAVVAQAMRPFVEDRVVCDLGCGGGDLLWLMSRYADRAIGIEVDHRRGQHAQARAACTDSMQFLSMDYFQKPLPRADVYYAWPNDPDTFAAIAERLKATRSPCLFAAGAHIDFFESERNPAVVSVENRLGRGRQCHVLGLVEKYGGKVLTFPFREETARPGEWSGTGHWGLAVITL